MKFLKDLKRRPTLLILTSLLLMGACGRVKFEIDRLAFVPLNVLTNINNAKVKCAEAAAAGTMLESTQDIFFETVPECKWEEDGNFSKINSLIRARQEQYIDIELPANATLCDMEFDFPEQNDMSYDDEILLTLGGKVLFSSQDYSLLSGVEEYDGNGDSGHAIATKDDGLMVDSLGLVHYKWDGDNGLANLFYGWEVSQRYCLGVDPADNDTDCIIPLSETTGQFKINIDKENIIKIGQLNGLTFDDEQVISVSKPLEIGFITTGDNDTFDCEHTDFDFDVKLKYVIQPETTTP